MHTPINAPINKPVINPNILTPSFSNFLLNTPTAENKKSSAVGIKSIVLDSSNFHAILLSLFILDALRQGTHQTALHYSLIGISPPWGSPTAALFGYDGSITLDF